jgi:hypothetical protein
LNLFLSGLIQTNEVLQRSTSVTQAVDFVNETAATSTNSTRLGKHSVAPSTPFSEKQQQAAVTRRNIDVTSFFQAS